MRTYGFEKTLASLKEGASLVHDYVGNRAWVERKDGARLWAVNFKVFCELKKEYLVKFDTTGTIDYYSYDHARFDSVYGEAVNA
ncbi:MAG: hypothetical protein FWH12_06360 [Treponema sp.]|nr:hypothetical protein [Treponema sp.]